MIENPSLRAEPRYQQAPVLPSSGELSILEWLENSGRLISRDSDDKVLDAEEEEIAALMGGEDNKFEEDDDDFDEDD